MAILCDVLVSSSSSTNSNQSRYSKARITFEKKISGIHLVVTRLAADGTAGSKIDFQIAENVKKIFSKFIKEGKSTIRFITPAHDLSLKGKQEDVIKIVSAVSKVANLPAEKSSPTKKPFGLVQHLEPCGPPSEKKQKFEVEKTKLELNSHKEYIHENHLPQSLKVFKVLNASISRLDSRCLRLSNLCHLQVNNTLLEQLPKSMNIFPHLSILDLASNRLESLPRNFFKTLSPKLVHLNLSCNKLRFLSDDISAVKNLEHLNVQQNSLTHLPWKIGLLTRLSTLLVNKNEISVLPYTLTTKYVNKVDISDNPMDAACVASFQIGERVRSLFEISALIVLNASIPYKNYTVPLTVEEELEYAFTCYCGKRLITPEVTSIIDLRMKHLSRDFEGPSIVPLQAVACSEKCLRRFRISMGH